MPGVSFSQGLSLPGVLHGHFFNKHALVAESNQNFGAFCLAVGTLPFCQLMGFPLHH